MKKCEVLKIAVSGATGFVASALIPSLETSGHVVVPLGRSFFTNPDPKSLEGVDAVIHLAGESISGRWTSEKKAKIVSSRVETTRALCDAMGHMAKPPHVMICASAVGIYGDRGEAILDEKASPGRGFLPEVVVAWEAACEPARKLGIRVVNTRFGVILSPHGGTLAVMSPAYRMGLGGRLGPGHQWWSWVALDDVVAAIQYCIAHDELSGPVNVVAPGAVRQSEFARALAHVLHRPAVFPTPAMALKLALGQMANEVLLASAHVVPKCLTEHCYTFHHPELLSALQQFYEHVPVAL